MNYTIILIGGLFISSCSITIKDNTVNVGDNGNMETHKNSQEESIPVEVEVPLQSIKYRTDYNSGAWLKLGGAGLVSGGIIAGIGAAYTFSNFNVKTQVDAYNASNEPKNYTALHVGAGVAVCGLVSIIISGILSYAEQP